MNVIKGAYARHPVLFQSLVGYGVFASGDVMAQRLADPDLDWDHRRSLSIGLLGVVQNGFLLRMWYRTLDKFVTPKVCMWMTIRGYACILKRGRFAGAYTVGVGVRVGENRAKGYPVVECHGRHQGRVCEHAGGFMLPVPPPCVSVMLTTFRFRYRIITMKNVWQADNDVDIVNLVQQPHVR